MVAACHHPVISGRGDGNDADPSHEARDEAHYSGMWPPSWPAWSPRASPLTSCAHASAGRRLPLSPRSRAAGRRRRDAGRWRWREARRRYKPSCATGTRRDSRAAGQRAPAPLFKPRRPGRRAQSATRLPARWPIAGRGPSGMWREARGAGGEGLAGGLLTG